MKQRKLTTSQLAVSVAMATLISKLLGFVRELVMAGYYGAGYVTDAYTMGTSIPNTILAGIIGAIATAYMPVFSKRVADYGEDEGNRFTSQIINWQAAVSAVFCIAGWCCAPWLVSVFAPGYSGETAVLTAFYLKVGFIICLLNCVKMTLQSFLEYKGSFLINVVLGYFQNISIIAMIILSSIAEVPKLLIGGLLLGDIIFTLGNVFKARKLGFKYSFSFVMTDALKEVMALAIPVFISSCLGQINTFIDRLLASGLPEGSVSALNYGNTLVGVITSFSFGIIITILYPRLSKAFAENDTARISSISERTLNLIAVLAVPFTFGALAYSSEVIQVIYERGAFTEEATAMTATAFFFYAIAICFNGIKSFLDRLYNSVHDAKTAALVSSAAVVMNIILNLILVKYMQHAGLALATSISQIISTVIAYLIFRKKYADITLMKSWRKVGLSVIFSLIAVGVSRFSYDFIGARIWMPRMVLLGLAVIIAVIIYLAFLMLFKFDELKLIKELVKRN